MTDPNDPLWAVKELIQSQPWYKRFSNTVTAGVGSVVGLIWLTVSFGVDVPDDVSKWVFAIIGVLTMLGILKTPNGMTEGQLREIKEVTAGRHRKI
jgi:uncharacterized membrane protein